MLLYIQTADKYVGEKVSFITELRKKGDAKHVFQNAEK